MLRRHRFGMTEKKVKGVPIRRRSRMFAHIPRSSQKHDTINRTRLGSRLQALEPANPAVIVSLVDSGFCKAKINIPQWDWPPTCRVAEGKTRAKSAAATGLRSTTSELP